MRPLPTTASHAGPVAVLDAFPQRRASVDVVGHTGSRPASGDRAGLRLAAVVRGELPPGGRKRGNVEMYSERRFVAVTGSHLDFTPLSVQPRGEQLALVHAHIFGPDGAGVSGQAGGTAGATEGEPPASYAGPPAPGDFRTNAKIGDKAVTKRILRVNQPDFVTSPAPIIDNAARWSPTPLSALAGEGADLDWLWRGYLAPNTLTSLTALWKSGKNLFAGSGYAGLSDTGMHAIGGLLKHAPALCAITNPTTNSYKRLVPGYEAPVNLAYSRRNRSASIRIPVYSSSEKAKRLEFRCPDGSCNPYLAFASMLMAIIDGIKNKTQPGEPLDKDIYDLEPEELAMVPKAPGSLDEALNNLERDHEFLLQGDVFTRDVISTWIWYKREKEVDAIRLRPHPYEFALYYDI